jgi:GTP-binding protein YchF
MGFKMGIVGLPNVGKSTLFNALTRTAAAQAANFPFCTIEPNVGEVAVPDARLEVLAGIAGSKTIIPTRMTFVDIAGLVRGASKGEGLGNQFLANIRECDAIAHVLRCFEDGDITHVEGRIDPVADAETIETELMLADMESIERRLVALGKKLRGGDQDTLDQDRLLRAALAALNEGKPARTVKVAEDDQRLWRQLMLLTSKPVLYVCNVEEAKAASGNSESDRVAVMAKAQGAGTVVISARIEEELAQMPSDDAAMFLEEMGLHEAGLDRLIKAGYALLGLQTYFTVGPKEARAWTIPKGTLAPQAAGVIHGDFEKGFIRSETVGYDDYVAGKGEAGAKEAGKFRVEGKTYEVKDGDVLHFLFNARLMGVKPTGNGRRESFAHIPMPRMTNTYMLSGNDQPEGIVASLKDGIYAVGFGGGQVDITNGKFVFSCTEAYRVKNGVIGAPVKGATLIGDGATALKGIRAIGNDLSLDPGIGNCGKAGQWVPVGVGQPTLVIGGLTVGGAGG